MRHLATKTRSLFVLALALLFLPAAALPATAPAALVGAPASLPADSTVYSLTWGTVDAGGHTFSTGGGYALGGTAGQPDAGLSIGGGYTLAGGFWGGGAIPIGYKNHLPLLLRNRS